MTEKLRPRHELEQALERIAKTIEFKDAHLELTSDARTESLLTFIREHFHPDEVLAKSLGYDVDEEFDQLFKISHKDNLSLLLISDKTDEIIACRTIILANRAKSFDFSKLKNDKLIKLFIFITHKNEEMNVYKRFNIDTCVDFVFLGTHKEHRRQGIAFKIFQAALQFSKELGIDPVCIKGEGTGIFSQRVYEKSGFETLHDFIYDDYKVDGDIVFKDTGIHKSTKVYVKQL
ncbi:Hypothetical predicted protein [Mytilus galloprovincialis]|uniref:N-acetyltransferase domain-containing protein n=1 Tax=Mytilus galloprovincialis TaxID=29158 RepID=A0A8B6CEL7_MYTGA|nr:Hypothetical predicted protein [Mytilus galloprovincialis]